MEKQHKHSKIKCVHRLYTRGHGANWCVLYRRDANCGSCKVHEQVAARYRAMFRRDQRQAEDRCHRKGCPAPHIYYMWAGGFLSDTALKAGGPMFTKHHETIMKRNKTEKMKEIHKIYGGLGEYLDKQTPYDKYIAQLKKVIQDEKNRMARHLVRKCLNVWFKDNVTANMRGRSYMADWSKIEARLLARPGVTKVHDEFIIDEKRWVSPVTEGELVTYKGGLVRVLKITGPLVKVKYQSRHSASHFNVMDWELEKRSVKRWVVKLMRKLWTAIK